MKELKNIYISRLGNKTNDIKFFKKYLNKNISTIVEPFSGMFAVIRNEYNDDKYKKIINDIDKKLINFLLLIKDNHVVLNDIYKDINTSEMTNGKDINKYIKEKYLDHSTMLIDHFIQRGMFKKIKKVHDFTDLSLFLNKCEITCKDYKDIFEEYKDNKEALLFLDPPYFDSFNSKYNTYKKDCNEEITDNTQMYIDILKYLKKCQCKVLLILNKNAITQHIYKKYIKGEYEKIYQLTKKKTQHLIISNYIV